jgi:S-sulfosulfanyl-L-cysteine sulfohydrolase
MDRREFLQVMAAASALGAPIAARSDGAEAETARRLYDVPPSGNVHLLHLTDCHAQLRPIYFREPSVNLGAGPARGRIPHRVGRAMLQPYAIGPASLQAYALTSLDFESAARRYGAVGGFAHLATLVQRLRAQRPGALLLDGGDTWQGSATALWTHGQDMVDAARLLGVDMMTVHWDLTLGTERVMQIDRTELKDRIELLAQNIRTSDFGDLVFASTSHRVANGVPLAVIGQAYPYVPIAHPRSQVAGWTFGIRERDLQAAVDAARAAGAQVVVLLSHNGMDVDLKLAGRVRGIDAILGGHTHDAVPRPVVVRNPGGATLVTNAGSHGKFLAVLDLDVRDGQVRDYRYRLLPVLANLLPADPGMQRLIEGVRTPFAAQLVQPLAVTEGTLYRRGNFNGTFDQVILDALLRIKGAQIAFSPGFRWGTTLLPGDTITMEDLMAQTAITYPWTTTRELSGERIKAILEDVADNLFNPDPYLQQGGDMVRSAGLSYSIDPDAPIGRRIDDLRVGGVPLSADRVYKVAGWAPVNEDVEHGPPIWEVVAEYLRDAKVVKPRAAWMPRLRGVAPDDPGLG